MLFLASLLLLGAASASASTLFISDFSGKVTSVQLKYDTNAAKYNFENATPYGGCGANPSWLTVDSGRGVLYCIDEAIRDGTTGGPTSYSIKKDGSLVKVKSATGLKGSVSAAVVGEPTEQQALVVANFVGGTISTFLLQCNGDFPTTPQQTLPLNGSVPADQQKLSLPHQALVDPTGQYVLVPDFGLDQVHVLSWNQTSHNLAALAPLQVKPAGSGPRHGVFWNPSGVACDTCPTYYFLVSELTSRVTSYRVTYLPDGKGLNFTMVDASPTTDYFALPPVVSTTAGVNHTTPGVNYPAEVVISPDNRFLIISNRNSNIFTLPGNDTTDSLATIELRSDGHMAFRQLWSSFGLYPRHFSLNKVGSLVAVANQHSKSVTVLARDVVTGFIGGRVARYDSLEDEATSVVWA